MSLFKRIGDIISANLNEMMDQFEDPEKMLKQAVREMEDSIADATKEAATVIAGEKRLAKELAANRKDMEVWQERAEQAVSSGDDELARKALSRRREHEKLTDALQDQFDTTKEAADTLRRQLDGMKAKLEEAKRNLATLSARKKAADVRKQSYSELGAVDVDNSAFQKFDRMREKVERAEAEAEALAELQGAPGAVSPRDDEDLEIEAQLAELKRQKADSDGK